MEPRWGPSQLSSLARCIAPAVTSRSLVTDQELPSQVISGKPSSKSRQRPADVTAICQHFRLHVWQIRKISDDHE